MHAYVIVYTVLQEKERGDKIRESLVCGRAVGKNKSTMQHIQSSFLVFRTVPAKRLAFTQPQYRFLLCLHDDQMNRHGYKFACCNPTEQQRGMEIKRNVCVLGHVFAL